MNIYLVHANKRRAGYKEVSLDIPDISVLSIASSCFIRITDYWRIGFHTRRNRAASTSTNSQPVNVGWCRSAPSNFGIRTGWQRKQREERRASGAAMHGRVEAESDQGKRQKPIRQ
eukprot:3814730-Pleurochrysis_carterae.AAC.1